MKSFGTRLAATLVASGLLLAALGASQALAARGGLSIEPGIVERIARPGGVGAVKISNTSRAPMKVRFAVRPWKQARNGDVEPNRARRLGRVRPSLSWFRLGAGATRTVGIGLKSRPRLGSLYGAIEVLGIPPRRRGSDVRVAPRVVTTLRLHAPRRARRFRAKAGHLRQWGSTRRGGLLLAVRNMGNTIRPIGGRVRIRGRARTVRAAVEPETILPGRTVNLRLTRLRGDLPRGRYKVGVLLKQGKRKVGVVTRRIFLR